MLIDISQTYSSIATWLNTNGGVLSVGIFGLTLFLGWISGIFSALRRRPKFQMGLIEGPTFCCTFPLGRTEGEYDTHRTVFALYLNVANIGSAASSIDNVSVAYHWDIRPISISWLRNAVGWFWLKYQAVALDDFQIQIGENIKVYPFLTQRSIYTNSDPTTYLDVGQSAKGVAYFEQEESWGGCYPKEVGGKVRVKVRITDVFGKFHHAKFWVPKLSFEEASKFNPQLGQSLEEVRRARSNDQTRI